MLTYLRISNFAILDEVELEFGPGMTVLTGETGAGKSLILDAVALLRGGRAPAEVCGGLIDIAGQHEHQSLLDTSRHLRLLDRSGVPDELLRKMSQAHDGLERTVAALRSASLDERSRIEREEFLRFQLDEIRA